jgi:hypothetical protein
MRGFGWTYRKNRVPLRPTTRSREAGARTLLLGALLLAPAPPVLAQAVEPDWGSRPFEIEKPEDDALVAALEREGNQLLSRIRQVRNDTEAFLANRSEGEQLTEAYTHHADYRNRNDLFERRYQAEREAKALFDDADAVYTPEDLRRAEARASLWRKSLDWRRRRNAARQAQLALLDSRLVVMRGLAGLDWEEFWQDNAEDLVFVYKEVLVQYPSDVAKCLISLGWTQVSAYLGAHPSPDVSVPAAPIPIFPDLVAKAGSDCVIGSGYGALVNAFEAAWKKQFLDSMRERGVLEGVAEYWWDEIVAAKLPEDEALLDQLRRFIAKETEDAAKGAASAYAEGVTARTLAARELPQLRQRFESLSQNASPASRRHLSEQMRQSAAEGGRQRAEKLMQASKLLVDYSMKAAELYANSRTFAEIEANELARYRRVIRCLEARREPVTAEAVKGVLRDASGFAAFVRECHAQDPEAGRCGDRARAAAASLLSASASGTAARSLVATLEARLGSLESEARAATAALARELEQVREACAAPAAAASIGGLVAELTALAASQAPLVTAACAPDASRVERAARQAREIASNLSDRVASELVLGGPSAPAALELGPLRQRADDLASEAAGLRGLAASAPEGSHGLPEAIRRGEDVLRGCAASRDPEVDALRSRLAQARSAPRGSEVPTAEAIAALVGRVEAVRRGLEERAAAQRDGRACLAGAAPSSLRAPGIDRLQRLLADTVAAAERAEACASAAAGSGGRTGGDRPGGFDTGALVGRPLREAVGLVTAAGLRPAPQVGGSAPTEDLVGKVESATLRGDEVVLVAYVAAVAAGRVPNVQGRPLREAHAAVAGAGFTPVVELGDDAPSAEAVHTVASQAPPPGAEIETGGDVVLTVYGERSSPGRVVPSLVGLRLGEARRLLESRDLMIDASREEDAPSAEAAGRVYRQYPEAAIEIPQGVGVRVWVYGDYRAPEPVEQARQRGGGGGGVRTASGPLEAIVYPERIGWVQMKPGWNKGAVLDAEGWRLDRPAQGWTVGPALVKDSAVGRVHQWTSGPTYEGEELLTVNLFWAEPGDPGSVSCSPDPVWTGWMLGFDSFRVLVLRSARAQAAVEFMSPDRYDWWPDVATMREAADFILEQLEPHAKPCE